MTMLLGCDVSAMQGLLNAAHFAHMKANGVEFMIHRVGIGNDGTDVHFKSNVALAKAAGITVGLYQFPYIIPVVPGKESRAPEAQADAHWAACAGIANEPGVDIITFADLEWPSDGEWAKWNCSPAFIEDFTCKYKARYVANSGRRMGSYTYPWWAKAANLSAVPMEVLGDLWQAGPYVTTGMPAALPTPILPWTSMGLCQFTGGKTGDTLPNTSPVDWDCATPESLASLIL